METVWRRRLPAAPLRGLVDEYVGYRMTGHLPALHRGLPSRHLTFIVSIGPGIEVVRQSNPALAPATYRVVVSGLQASSAVVAHRGAQEGVAVALSPLGGRALLGLPARELWDLSLEASDVVGRAGDELWERVQEAASWEERFDTCDRVLLGWLREVRTTAALAGAWDAIVTSGGTAGVGRLAREAGYSRQHLTRLFRRELGLGPKLASRIVRFERAAGMLRSDGSPGTVARVAALTGYADQAHLAREVAALAGCTPVELAAGDVPYVGDVPNVQDAAPPRARR